MHTSLNRSADKAQRQARLLQLVRRERLSRQAQIVRAMRREGFEVTQASVSRDIHELGLVKADGRYVSLDTLSVAAPPDVPAVAAGMVVGVEAVGQHLIVVRTTKGNASTVAVELDDENLAGVAGTIAGDDTIFVAVRGPAAQRSVAGILRGWVRSVREG